jgi:hypothetical protein
VFNQNNVDDLLELLFSSVKVSGNDTLGPLRGAWVLLHDNKSGNITGLLFDAKLQQIPLACNERIRIWEDYNELFVDEQQGEYPYTEFTSVDKTLVSIYDLQNKELARMELLGMKPFKDYAKLMEWVKNERGY